ncbi:Prenyltransferase and squalene oxidase repeat-containing protein [Thermomonospora echinospora]|uniref:Prenyltransferase and squalene oxidase repeat-containing protein n=1 Tax=Thermomonospora echinospora TaxID=1992 RepID=A0A1H6CUG3_9ACTN|nr:prenyltransferase/squalene oxidase repeat-containing protein [Thermomonospora echinospora]SEG76046.1 Prenyltransferase and squalene oxidase repeat-containing protein [Thermomonospora echinospora]
MHVTVRRVLVPLTAGAVVVGGAALPAQAAPDLLKQSAVKAAQWQSRQLNANGVVYNPQYQVVDWGLTLDTLIALRATGVKPAVVKKSTAYVAGHVRSYNSFDDWGQQGVRLAGPTGKLLYVAVATKSNPRKFGKYNLRAESLGLMVKSGPDKGRFKDRGTTDNSNTFGQSFNVLGLARSGGVPREAVTFLIRQQCKAGGFRLSPNQFGTPAPTCDKATKPVLDPDSTGIAVQALLAAYKAGDKPAGDAARKGALWLKRIQRKDGSFGGSGPTAASNTNSTGLAGQALRAVAATKLVTPKTAGELRQAANRAGHWVRTHQLTPANAGKARPDVGAIAYNRAALRTAAEDGITQVTRDQWRRATPQALLVLARVSLADIGR